MPKTETAIGTHISHPYAASSLDQKVHNKTALQKELGWPEEPKRPVVCFPCGMSPELGGELLEPLLDGLLTLPVELLILGKGPEEYGKMLSKVASDHKHRAAIIPNKESEIEKMIAGSDVALFLSTEIPEETLKMCLNYGVVPIAPTGNSLLSDYNPVQETGNAFLYEKCDIWNAFGAMVRATETLRFPFDWKTIQKHCMKGGA